MVVAGPVRSQAAGDAAHISARDAYRKGKRALAAKQYEAASAAFEFAARQGVLGAQLELARMYAKGQGVARSDAKSFQFYQQIADKHADASPPHPAAGYAAEAFVALAESYRGGISELRVPPDIDRAVRLLRHAASYFGDPTAQYKLARLYLAGEGVPKNVRLAAAWLANAAKKQHAESQALLAELLWRGDKVLDRQPVESLALLSMAHQKSAGDRDRQWIVVLYQRILAETTAIQRKGAARLVARWRELSIGDKKKTAGTPRASKGAARVAAPPSVTTVERRP